MRHQRRHADRTIERQLRQAQTEPEQILWRLLRARRFDNAKFRRQHRIGNYVLDFYCPTARLAIELDGPQHAEDAQHRFDNHRTRDLNNLGIRVLRFDNGLMYTDPDRALREIAATLALPLLPPAISPNIPPS